MTNLAENLATTTSQGDLHANCSGCATRRA